MRASRSRSPWRRRCEPGAAGARTSVLTAGSLDLSARSFGQESRRPPGSIIPPGRREDDPSSACHEPCGLGPPAPSWGVRYQADTPATSRRSASTAAIAVTRRTYWRVFSDHVYTPNSGTEVGGGWGREVVLVPDGSTSVNGDTKTFQVTGRASAPAASRALRPSGPAATRSTSPMSTRGLDVSAPRASTRRGRIGGGRWSAQLSGGVPASAWRSGSVVLNEGSSCDASALGRR